MKTKLVVMSALLFSQVASATVDKSEQTSCGSKMNVRDAATSQDKQVSSGPPLTTLPLPVISDADLQITAALNEAALAYGENAKAIRRGLSIALRAEKIQVNQIHSIEYWGALESLPPKHQFHVKTLNGTATTLSVTAAEEGDSARPSFNVPITTLPLPGGNGEEAISRAVYEAAKAHDESANQVGKAFDAALKKAGINATDIYSVEYEGATGGIPLHHSFKITLVKGNVEILQVFF